MGFVMGLSYNFKNEISTQREQKQGEEKNEEKANVSEPSVGYQPDDLYEESALTVCTRYLRIRRPLAKFQLGRSLAVAWRYLSERLWLQQRSEMGTDPYRLRAVCDHRSQNGVDTGQPQRSVLRGQQLFYLHALVCQRCQRLQPDR